MEYDPKLTTAAIYIKELLQEKGCSSEESCVVLLDVISDLIVEYAKGDTQKLSACASEWSSRIIKEVIKKTFEKFPIQPKLTLPPLTKPER